MPLSTGTKLGAYDIVAHPAECRWWFRRAEPAARSRTGVRPVAGERMDENRVNELLLAAQPGEQRQIDIARLARLAPTLYGHAADHTVWAAPSTDRDSC